MTAENTKVVQKGLQVRVSMTLEPDLIKKQYAQRLQSVASKTKIRGFRKGKMAQAEIERRSGAIIRAEAIEEMIQGALGQAIKDNKHEPANTPKLDKSDGDGVEKPVVAEVVYEVFPAFPEVDLGKFKVDVVEGIVSDENVAEEITKLQEHLGTWSEVDRVSKEGDQIKMDFAGRLDGELFEGGSATDQTIDLGEGRFLPDFESNLVGKKAKETVTFPVTFPSDYQNEDLAGKKADFEVQVNAVSEKVKHDINEEFYQKAGSKCKDQVEFEKEIKDRLEKDLGHLSGALNRKRLSKVLLKKIGLDVPSSILTEEQAAIAKRDEKLSAKEVKKKAEESIRIALILKHYINEYGVKATPQAIKDHIALAAPAQVSVDMFFDWYVQDKNRLQQAQGAVLEQMALDKVLEGVSQKTERKSLSQIEVELKEESA